MALGVLVVIMVLAVRRAGSHGIKEQSEEIGKRKEERRKKKIKVT